MPYKLMIFLKIKGGEGSPCSFKRKRSFISLSSLARGKCLNGVNPQVFVRVLIDARNYAQ
jgi:hypothetical protein